jgi:hypothetical protein
MGYGASVLDLAIAAAWGRLESVRTFQVRVLETGIQIVRFSNVTVKQRGRSVFDVRMC